MYVIEYIYILFSIIVYYRMLYIVPYTIQYNFICLSILYINIMVLIY